MDLANTFAVSQILFLTQGDVAEIGVGRDRLGLGKPRGHG